MKVTRKHAAAMLVSAAAGVLVPLALPAVGQAQEPVPVCPVGMYWNVEAAACLYDVDVYVNPPNPIVGPVGPVGVGGVVGPVGVGPVGPGPVGPGPVGPGPVGPRR
ncbi:Uncharacterised protein [Mycolicibacterium aurum]|uniref:Uncharacterized protein n=1 Tax=Mycolicibacterium aurum TaxID=1791 RepID=A0A3S5EJR1_MYCAU|nr:hypothetical protein [Mycolicibacterium aurum]VEG56789.1 Uncharacterised protein [Mycolicibacterium aurum]